MSTQIVVTPIETDIIVVTIPEGARGAKGEKGDAGTGNLDVRIVAIGEVTSNGTTGVTVAVAGMTSSSDYVVLLTYNDIPGGNGVPFCTRTQNDFTIKHYGSTFTQIGYTVIRKVSP